MSLIESVFENKAQDNTEAKKFLQQWHVAKNYVPQVLNTISQVFPHYSLHDSSHSEAILRNVERVLGSDQIKEFSITDLWFMLCVAYYHDFGMALNGEDFTNIFKDKDFFDFVSETQADKSSSLYDYANVFEQTKEGLQFRSGITLNAKSYNAARYLIAEYIRKQHASRSKDAISHDDTFCIPGCQIPKRLLELIGQICKLHTDSFENVMLLPQIEMGVGSDDCHPRFIACMLRIGDLLDLDNNRFSDVLLTSLPSIPVDSLWHKEKHLSMTRIHIGHELIELSATCTDDNVYDITNSWFKMLTDELDRQRAHWNAISGYPGFNLPCVGEIKVTLKGWDTIDGKTRPRFQIDSNKAIEMLQGAGLYTAPHQCIREILQNAVDATSIRIFQESEINDVKIKSYKEFKDACLNKKIRVCLDKTEKDADFNVWTVSIRDEGIGMSKEDMQYLFKTGSKNEEKLKLIKRMPEFMKPSGTFGIGFQSIFLLTDIVNLTSHKVGKEYMIDSLLYNPAKEKHGAIRIRTSNKLSPYGTEVKFSFQAEKIVKSFSINSNEREASMELFGYDFVHDNSIDLDAARIVQEVRKFSQESLIPIILNVCGTEMILKSNEENPLFTHLTTDNSLEFSVFGKSENYKTLIYYRGQLVEKAKINLMFMSIFANILSGDAKDKITLNRNELQSKFAPVLNEQLTNAIQEYLINNYSSLEDKCKPEASMYLLYYGLQNRMALPADVEEEWKKYTCNTFRIKPLSLGKIVEQVGSRDVYLRNDAMAFNMKDNKDNVVIDYPHDDSYYFLHYYFHKSYPYSGLRWIGGRQYVLYSNHTCELIGDMACWLRTYSKAMDSPARSLMPCNQKYLKLRIKDDFDMAWSMDRTSLFMFPVPHMICPYVKEVVPGYFCNVVGIHWDDNDGKLTEMIYENRYEETTSMEEIVTALQSYRQDTENIVDSINVELNQRK